MIVLGYINIYFNGKECWTGSDIHKDINSAKRLGLSLAKTSRVICLGQRLLSFDTDTFETDAPAEEIVDLEDTTDTRCTRKLRPRSHALRRTRKPDTGEET